MTATVLDHPLVHDRLARLRDRDCPPAAFREHLARLAPLLLSEATQNLATTSVTIRTPLEEMNARQLARPLVLAPILRAGLALLTEFHRLLPEADVAHLGMRRDEETLEPHTYYKNFPSTLPEADVLVLDPMLATGHSAVAALSLLKQAGAQRLHFISLVASPEGLAYLEKSHPEVAITTAAVDRGLDDHAYIVPGLGDAGDRVFGTT